MDDQDHNTTRTNVRIACRCGDCGACDHRCPHGYDATTCTECSDEDEPFDFSIHGFNEDNDTRLEDAWGAVPDE